MDPPPHPFSALCGASSVDAADANGTQGHWEAVGVESGTKFTGIEFDEGGEWYDYDEKAGEEVGITGTGWEIRRA